VRHEHHHVDLELPGDPESNQLPSFAVCTADLAKWTSDHWIRQVFLYCPSWLTLQYLILAIHVPAGSAGRPGHHTLCTGCSLRLKRAAPLT
jgi:hypothetical protein